MTAEVKVKVLRIPAPHTDHIRLRDLTIEEKYQRRVSPAHVAGMVAMLRGCTDAQIAKKFSEYAGFICVARRKNGVNKVLDGQQRCAVIMRVADELGFSEIELPCEIIESRGVKHEADVYNRRNHRKGLTPADKFKSRCAEGEPAAVELQTILDAKNLGVAGLHYSKPVHKIKCVKTFEHMLELGGKKLVTTVIDIIFDIWGRTASGTIRPWPELKNAFKTEAVGGIGVFLNENPDCNINKLKKKLAAFDIDAFVKRLEPPAGSKQSGYERELWAAHGVASIYSPKENAPVVKVRGMTR